MITYIRPKVIVMTNTLNHIPVLDAATSILSIIKDITMG